MKFEVYTANLFKSCGKQVQSEMQISSDDNTILSARIPVE